MHSSVSSTAQPEAILEWLQKEMEYRPLGPYIASNKASIPSADSMRKICRGNMIPVWNFLLKRVKSEKTVENIRRNILVHGGDDSSIPGGDASKANDVGRNRGRKKERVRLDEEASSSSSAENAREIALHERDLAEKEVERLGHIVRRQRRELKERMLEVSREEAERKRMLDERSNYRHKQVMLEAYEQQCDEAIKIFTEYHKRFRIYVSEAKDSQRLNNDPFSDMKKSFSPNSEKGAFYSTVKGNKQADDIILIETARERNIRKACESLAMQMIEKIRISFPAYEGSGVHLNPQVEAAKLGIDFDEDIPDEVKKVALNCLKSPPLLLQGIIEYTKRLKAFITRENEKIDIRSDAETLRYKYENNRVMNVSSSDPSSPLQYQLIGNGKITAGAPSSGSPNQIFERQNAHVQQILATEDALNKAAEARNQCQKLIKRLHGSDDLVSSQALFVGDTSHNVGTLRQLEFDVWAKERDVAGLRASLSTLMSEVQRLNKACLERKEAEDSLRKKWTKIEEFDARRSELEFIYNALLRATTDAAAFWSQQPLAAREYASSTIVPACTVVLEISNRAKDFIEKEVSAFYSCPDNRLCMLPSTPQALLDSMGISSTGPEAVATAEKNAALLTARAGARDPSAIPSICRISAALQYPAGLEGSDAGLASVLESLEFCLKLRGSEACVLEDLAKAMNTVHIRRDLVESGHALLNHASRAQQEYERTTSFCLDLAAEQENAITEKWVPELRNASINAKKCLEDCKYIRGLVDEWWEQPASTIVDWVAVDGENVGAWVNHVKQLLTFYDKELL
ncbi:AUGMIN subunit 5-like [Impatiens glandulifera]|uniref:AUGMIN subunit 5-like n=1 Tax=Impatiens glandulifera TaxID=253017 RepID=UPI001FB16E24|nr:AUGMIN subunit 5-like [Impatiens glandulifera]